MLILSEPEVSGPAQRMRSICAIDGQRTSVIGVMVTLMGEWYRNQKH